MTHTAIVSALHDELASVLALMPDEHQQVVGGREFWVGHLHGQDVVAVLSGIGKVAAATTATLLIERFGVKRIVFTGVAGGLGSGVQVGDVVLARSFLQHDMDASPLFARHEVPGYGRARFDAAAGLTDALELACDRMLHTLPQQLGAETVAAFGLQAPRLHQGLLISGDRFVATTAESAALQRELPDALAVEMEGAAFAQVCHDFGVPLAVVRTISDRADDTAHMDFPRFLREVASRYSGAVVEALFSNR
ncbi:MAG: 5'-methylthioadenosine/adenosylhomocysteine nucleosidase [Hydrogenophaga sp.]|jgi:adenosylhomocysteine nucleosidase|uniref:5'-methylthioadenosine/adenosylhomocysteine nucleosidase n=1 Tax=Hydrogenophaga sp. TaxID=1904254 RepID=UPI00271DF186|nr:5'-methylthioadenosine/adenosylhomocysteine nucleosidase [Hydrogenophaga sp.]MDO9479170.1 5'-methylthioadenosine/adenosylhomocysteine nucleosidase [Hydrogenophaga sp.]MDO9572124.1 5'-methylthioadenosine/adenosylhomocysteine nucleosidase [Hydrogenophaga sp.]MDP3347121.1 5'-methylthioadenosine/adenosylhomocysteine nucleosidase [Hydrogenophaga sp.]MDP3374005.1 5'-methylthioadenosine/adenosylhomocysteine nucleosidase [Hydrogenophaga sp.]MDP3805303.1 5'-methylthioadenosine/adenosylhomocysteine n